jgi:hypothetical protein
LSTFKPKPESRHRDDLAAAIKARREAAERASARSAELAATLARLSSDIAAPDAIRAQLAKLDSAEQSAFMAYARDASAPRPEVDVDSRDDLERSLRQATAAASAATSAKLDSKPRPATKPSARQRQCLRSSVQSKLRSRPSS